MKLTLKRLYKKSNYTVGKLYVDDEYFCDTLEDTDRGLKDTMSFSEIRKLKVYGKTAIPAGTYVVRMTWSKKYGKMLPEILNVKCFSGARIHGGVDENDTLGCVLVGKNKTKGKLWYSSETMNKFKKLLNEYGKDVQITIE